MPGVEQFWDDAAGKWGAGRMSNGAQKMVIVSNVTDYVSAKLTVTSSVIELKAGSTAMSGRKQLIIYPPTVGTIYWGKLADVQVGNGVPLSAGGSTVTIDIDPTNPPPAPYAVSDGTDRTVYVMEVK